MIEGTEDVPRDVVAKNGEANGSIVRSIRSHGANGTAESHAAAADAVRKDVQRVVAEALEEAHARGLPLTSGLSNGGGGNGHAHNGLNGHGAAALLETPIGELLTSLVDPPLPLVSLSNSLAPLAPRMEAVEAEIERLISSPVKLITDIASHTLNAGGKRLRPALTLLSAQLCGDLGEVPPERVVTCAAAIELTHTTTLLHDDVIDDADLRRGRPTANLLWGNESSVLVGDYLFAQVFVTAARRGYSELMFPLAHATAQMCAGELLETQTRRNLDMPEEQYREIIALKTAALTECACRLGANAMNASDEEAERLARYGYDLGMAFQIVDDVLDVMANAGRVGKPVGNDIREGDITLPMLRAMQVCTVREQNELRSIVNAEIIADADIDRALAIIRASDAVEYSLSAAAHYVSSAKERLADFPLLPAREMLEVIADYVLTRDR